MTDDILYMPRLLRAVAAERGNAVAMREKKFGIWQNITWQDYLEHSEAFGFGLAALGVTVGDRVAIQSDNRPEWLYADVGAGMLRAPIVGFYPTNPTAEVRYLLQDSGARVLVAEDQEQVDKAVEVFDDCPDLEWVVYLDSRGLSVHDHEFLISVDELVNRGAALRRGQPTLLAEVDDGRSPDDLVTLIYTSGTTGPAKGAMLSAQNVSFGTRCFGAESGVFGIGLTDRDIMLSYLPMSHVVERTITNWVHLHRHMLIHFAESIETVTTDLAEVQPTALFAVPRIWEKIETAVVIKTANASWLKRLSYRIARSLAETVGRERASNGGDHTAKSGVLYFFAWLLALRSLRRHLGLSKVRHALSGAAPIAPDVLMYFLGIGVPIYEAYGQTENAAVATTNLVGRMRVGTVGEPQPGIDLTIDESTGEVLTRHPGNFIGYWNKPEATAETLDSEGWLHTGDVGEWVGGTHLRIVDRIKDIIITAGGKNISPSELENSLKASPYIREAIVVGDRRAYLTVLIEIEFDAVADWAVRRHIDYTTYRDLATRPEVIELIAEAVRATNTKFARVESLRKFRMLHKELDHEDGELTATQKLKRASFAATVPHLIDDMYNGTEKFAGADLGREG